MSFSSKVNLETVVSAAVWATIFGAVVKSIYASEKTDI
jgi:hypothetical protein